MLLRRLRQQNSEPQQSRLRRRLRPLRLLPVLWLRWRLPCLALWCQRRLLSLKLLRQGPLPVLLAKQTAAPDLCQWPQVRPPLEPPALGLPGESAAVAQAVALWQRLRLARMPLRLLDQCAAASVLPLPLLTAR